VPKKSENSTQKTKVGANPQKLQALSYLDDMTDENLPKNTWILATGGFTQDESAIILGVSQAQISNILLGKYKRPKS